jgi:hypothetical protein
MSNTDTRAKQFTCGRCYRRVLYRTPPEIDYLTGRVVAGTRDACPHCEWSRHVAYGTDRQPPCGAGV